MDKIYRACLLSPLLSTRHGNVPMFQMRYMRPETLEVSKAQEG